MIRRLTLPLAVLVLLLSGCATVPNDPLPTVRNVDLQRFMGDWYVIAAIPTTIEKEAYNAIERYDLNPDGTIATTFTFRKGGFDGPLKKYTPRGFIRDPQSNAVWGMQFIWPIKAEYRIVYLAEDYSRTVIGRTRRDYAWIMARQPSIPEENYHAMVRFLEEQGYDVSRLRRVPHAPPATQKPS
jgi:apolipoprotein D and lipocalin family protein